MTHAVTGAFGYTGKYIAQRLLDAGHAVITLTNSPNRPNPFGDRIRAHPFNFDNPAALTESLKGVSVLYNTYWVRFNHRAFNHASALDNTRVLFRAAKEAGVERIVHVSITNPSVDSPFEYFRDKALLERDLMELGVSYAILRPAVIFGEEDILINNLAWTLRRLPVFVMFGSGRYRMQPIHVDDLAALAVREGASQENVTINAIGPETFTFRELAATLSRILGKRRLILPMPKIVGYLGGWFTGFFVNDVVVTYSEILGVCAGLLYVDAPPAGKTRLTEWAREHAATLGLRYTSEMSRRRNRNQGYR